MMNAVDPFETVVNEHYEPLYRFALSLTRSESDAMDLTQQTFYVWARKGHQLRDASKVKSWLYTTLHRTFLKRRQREIRFPHSELDEASAELPGGSAQGATEIDSAQALAALAHVDEIFRAAVALFFLEDCSHKEIAAILEVPVGTVKSRIARGVAQLRQMLLSGDNEPDDAAGEKPAFPKTRRSATAGSPAPKAAPPGTKVPFLCGNDPIACDSQR